MRLTNVVLAALVALAGCTPRAPEPGGAPAPSVASVVAPTATATPAGPRRPDGVVAPAPKEAQRALLVRLCAEKGLSGPETDAIVKAWFDGPYGPAPSDEVLAKAPFTPGEGHDLYVADVDNDGRDEWVITVQNMVGQHNDGIETVWAERDGRLVELPFLEVVSHDLLDGGTDWHANTGAPFIVVDQGMTYLSFRDVFPVDAQGHVVGPTEDRVRVVDVRYRYLWKEGQMKLVDKVDHSDATK